MKTRRHSRVTPLIALILLIGLPVFIWAVATQRIELRKRADEPGPPTVCTGANGSICTSTAHCPVCTTDACPQMACVGRPGVCQNGLCVPDPTPTPTPVNWCPENGKTCGTSVPISLPPCTPSTNVACPDGVRLVVGICQNNLCVPPPPGCTYGPMECMQSPCDAVLVCVTPTPTPTPTPPPPTPYPQSLDLWVRLAGVSGAGAQNAKLSRVKFYLKDGTIMEAPGELTLTYQPWVTVGGFGNIYHASFRVTNPLPVGTQFRLSVKGEKHAAVKFCANNQTGQCSETEYFTMTRSWGMRTLYLTGIPLPPGDLNQNGVIDAVDIKMVTDIFKKPTSQISAEDKKTADVNYDGYVDNFDLSLILQSLARRYDE